MPIKRWKIILLTFFVFYIFLKYFGLSEAQKKESSNKKENSEIYSIGKSNISNESLLNSEEENLDNIPLLNKSKVQILLSTNHGYVKPTIVSMTSICVNAKPTTYYELFLLVPEGDFSDEDSEKSLLVKERNQNSCNVTIINMGAAFKNAKLGYRIPPASYYRLSAPSLFKELERIIYVDGDVLALGDLAEMFNLDFNDNYALGALGGWLSDFQPFNISNYKLMICAGILLMNLKKMREDDFEGKIQNLIRDHKEKLAWHDQTALNIVGVNKLGLLPPKFGTFDDLNIDNTIDFYHSFRDKGMKVHTDDEIIKAFNSPILVHYNNLPKPWKVGVHSGYNNYFWYYAKKSPIYDEIYNDFLVEINNKIKNKNKK